MAREVEERKAKQNVRGEKASIKKGIPRILMGGLKNNAENSSSRLSSIHAEKAEKLTDGNGRHQKFTVADGQAENRLQRLPSAYGQDSGYGKGRQLPLSQPYSLPRRNTPYGDGCKEPLGFSSHLPAKKRRPPQLERKKRQWKNNPAETHHGRIAPHRRSDGACRLHLRLSGPGILPRP